MCKCTSMLLLLLLVSDAFFFSILLAKIFHCNVKRLTDCDFMLSHGTRCAVLLLLLVLFFLIHISVRAKQSKAHKDRFLFTDCITCHNCQIDSFFEQWLSMTYSKCATKMTSIVNKIAIYVNNKANSMNQMLSAAHIF